MVTLMQIVIFLNTSNFPQVTVLTHLEDVKQCERKIFDAFDRYNKAGVNTIVKKDDEGNSFLELSTVEDDTISYMLCKKAIFFKK